jgi:hypothetical protein
MEFDDLIGDQISESVTAAAAAFTASAVSTTTTTTAFTTRRASTAAVSTAAPAATCAARLARFSFAHAQSTTFKVFSVKGVDGSFAFGIIGHGDETEAATATGFAIHHDFGSSNGAVRREHTGQAFVVDRPWQVTDVEFHRILASGANAPQVALNCALGEPTRCSAE